MNRLFSALLFLFGNSYAQLPDTDIWLVKLGKGKTGHQIVQQCGNVTNRAGYDNQPFFSADGKKVYFTSIREAKQADVYFFTVKNPVPERITFSDISEYSPTPLPDTDAISSVVVEKDSSQKIHFINPLSGSHSGILAFDSVGYCCFINTDTVVYYKLTNPASLRYHVRSSGEDKFICSDPGRTIRKIDRHSVLFGIKDSTKVVHYKYDFLLRKSVQLAVSQGQGEDACWHKIHGLMRSDGNKLLRYDTVTSSWINVFEFSLFGIQKIGRFVFSADGQWLVLVELKDSK